MKKQLKELVFGNEKEFEIDEISLKKPIYFHIVKLIFILSIICLGLLAFNLVIGIQLKILSGEVGIQIYNLITELLLVLWKIIKILLWIWGITISSIMILAGLKELEQNE